MVNVIELVEQSNRNLEEIRCRQEQFLLQQFQCALDKGLEQRIQPLVRKKRRRTVPRPMSPSSTAYTGFSRHHRRDPSLLRDYRAIDEEWHKKNDDTVAEWNVAVSRWTDEEAGTWGPEVKQRSPSPVPSIPLSDFKTRSSMPLLADKSPPSYDSSKAYDVQAEIVHWVTTANPAIQGIEDIEETIAHLVTLASVSPPKLPLSVIICGVCDSHDHHTPDCSRYICYECDKLQAGHYPANCPNKLSSRHLLSGLTRSYHPNLYVDLGRLID
jgi:hypothetical protein